MRSAACAGWWREEEAPEPGMLGEATCSAAGIGRESDAGGSGLPTFEPLGPAAGQHQAECVWLPGPGQQQPVHHADRRQHQRRADGGPCARPAWRQRHLSSWWASTGLDSRRRGADARAHLAVR